MRLVSCTGHRPTNSRRWSFLPGVGVVWSPHCGASVSALDRERHVPDASRSRLSSMQALDLPERRAAWLVPALTSIETPSLRDRAAHPSLGPPRHRPRDPQAASAKPRRRLRRPPRPVRPTPTPTSEASRPGLDQSALTRSTHTKRTTPAVSPDLTGTATAQPTVAGLLDGASRKGDPLLDARNSVGTVLSHHA